MSPTEYLLSHWHKPQSENKNSPVTIENGPVDPREIPLSFRELLIAPVLLACGSYSSFTILDISFRTVLPVYLATQWTWEDWASILPPSELPCNHPGIDGKCWMTSSSFSLPSCTIGWAERPSFWLRSRSLSPSPLFSLPRIMSPKRTGWPTLYSSSSVFGYFCLLVQASRVSHP